LYTHTVNSFSFSHPPQRGREGYSLGESEALRGRCNLNKESGMKVYVHNLINKSKTLVGGFVNNADTAITLNRMYPNIHTIVFFNSLEMLERSSKPTLPITGTYLILEAI
jgi:hypothetical protein